MSEILSQEDQQGQTMINIQTTEEPIIKSFHYIVPILLLIAYFCVKIFDGAIVFGQLGPEDITFVIVSQGEINLLKTSIESVLNVQHYGKISKKIIVYDGLQTENLHNLTMTYQQYQIKWIITNKTLGQVASIDLGLHQVTTSYVFLSNGLWNYTQCLDLQISKALILMQSQDKISQVIVTESQLLKPGRIQLLDSQEAGFHIRLPSLMRNKQYRMISGRFTHLTNNISYGQSLGRLSILISMYFYQQGYYSYMLTDRCGQRMSNQFYDGYKYEGLSRIRKKQVQVSNQQRKICRVQFRLWSYLRKLDFKRRKLQKQLNNIFRISNTSIQNITQNISVLGFDSQIQICSQFDYMNITESRQFSKIKQLFPKVFVENLQFFYEKSNNYQQSEQASSSLFKNISEVTRFIKQKKSEHNSANEQQKLKQLLLQNPDDHQIYEAEQTYYSLKYGINKIQKNAKMCIFIEGRQLSSRMNISKLLLSISRQSYSNYSIAIVIEDQIGVNTNTYFHSLIQIYPKLKKHLKIITANQNVLGTPANYYVRAKKYCRGMDIVVSINGNSYFVGSQAFTVINSIYDNSQAWMAVFLSKSEDTQNVMRIFNNQGILQRSNYNPDTHLITFRLKLLESLPIQQLLQFNKEAGSEYLIPNFYKSQSNKFHVYPLVQMSGIEHIKFSFIPIYDYHELDHRHDKCWRQQQKWVQSKSLIKYPLNKLKKLGDLPSTNFEYILSDPIKRKVLQAKKHYISCLNPQPPIVKQNAFSSYLIEAINNMEESEYYITSEVLLMEHPHLPFCVLVDNNIQRKEQIRQSIYNQNYSNYSIIFVLQNSTQNQILIQISKQDSTDPLKQKIILVKKYNYDNIQQIIKQICPKNSVVMITNQALQGEALIKLNKIHQERNCWLTYSSDEKLVHIHSFYSRVFQLVGLNDFQNLNLPYLRQGDKALIALSMLQLCQKVSMRLNFNELFVQYIQNNISYKDQLSLTAKITNYKYYRRQKYQPLLQLSQDYQTDTQQIQQMIKQVKMSKPFPTRPRKNSYLTKMDYFKALEYEQIAYLPDNHMLNLREYYELNKKYQINKYRGDGEERMCVILLGRNNVARNRYVKNLMSIFMQNYTNFHVVYLDDFSSDGTLQKAIKFTQDQKFPNQKIIFIKNNKQVYATYNIANANFNFCDQDQIVVRVDSDDELLGRNVLSFINSIYKKYPDSWVVYANNDKNSKQFGMSTEIKTDEETRTCAGSRMHQHIIAHLTTWRVKLFRSIPLAEHLQEDGNWLKTLSDDAIQFPMIQLATMRRVKYVPYICYFYHDDHGANDHSNRGRVIERQNVFFFKLSQQPLKPLHNFSEKRTKNEQVENRFKNDYGTIFELAL